MSIQSEERRAESHRRAPATVGVVTPTLNAERYLEDCLGSVWSQASDLLAVDHVIRDGGSKDRTLDIAARYPSRVEVAPDGGMYEAVNRGMEMAQGEVIGYINADDQIVPGALDLVVRTFRERPDVQWVCGTVEFIDESGAVLGRMKPVSLSVRSYIGIGWSCIPQQTVWARRSFFDRVGPFDTAYRNCADYDWYVRAMRLCPPRILDATLGRFRIHEENLSYDEDAMFREARMVQARNDGLGRWTWVLGKFLSLRLNARNPAWFVAKKTGKTSFIERSRREARSR